MKIRGAFFFFFIPMIIAAISSIFAAVAGLLATVGAIVAQIGAFIATAVANIAVQIGTILQGIGSAIYQGIQYAGATFGKFFGGNIFSSSVLQNGFGNFSLNTFGSKLIDQAVSIGLRYGTSMGLEALGVDPTIARFAGAFVSGGVVGNIGPMFDAGAFIDGGIQALAFEATKTLFESAGISTTFSSFFALTSQNFLDGVIGGTLNNAIVEIAKNLEITILKYGFETLGDAIGLPQELSQALGGPIAGLIYSKLPSVNYDPQITTTDTQGQSVIDNDYYFDIERQQNIPIPGPSSPERSWWDNAIRFFQDNLPEMIGVGIAAYYLTHPGSNFNNNNPGPIQVDSPAPAGSTNTTYKDLNGITKDGYKVQTGSNSYEIYDKKTGMLVERSSGGITERGRFSYKITRNPDGSMSLDLQNPEYVYEGSIDYQTPQNGEVSFKIAEREVDGIYLEKPSADVVLSPGATTDEAGRILNGSIDFVYVYLELIVNNGRVTNGNDGNSVSSRELTTRFSTVYIFGNGFENEYRPPHTTDPLMERYELNLEEDKVVNPLAKLFICLYEETKLVGNAIDWFTDFQKDLCEDMMRFFGQTTEEAIRFLSDANSSSLVPGIMRPWYLEFQKWFRNATGLGNNLVQETIDDIEAYIRTHGQIKNGIAFVHSGATAPLLAALEQMKYDVNTVIIYEGPHPNYHTAFTNPYLKRIIHVQGTGGPLDGDSYVPFLGQADFGGVENINIQIKGAFHNDFSYNPSDYADRTLWGEKEIKREFINKTTNLFMRRLYKRALEDRTNPGDLTAFLESLEIDGSAEYENGVWKIDPFKLNL